MSPSSRFVDRAQLRSRRNFGALFINPIWREWQLTLQLLRSGHETGYERRYLWHRLQDCAAVLNGWTGHVR